MMESNAITFVKNEIWVVVALLAVCSIVGIPMLLGSLQGTGIHRSGDVTGSGGWIDFWLVRLALNLVGYGTIFVPLWLLARYLKTVKFDERVGSGVFARMVRLFVFGRQDSLDNGKVSSPSPGRWSSISHWLDPPPGSTGHYVLLVACCAGLQASYLTWGVLQERIMTHDYNGERFHNSQFLVFVNRVLACVLACIILALPPLLGPERPAHRTPMLQYAYSSLSNILSSWCQYEALKFVSFPTQVLAKASKIIPVMLMGRLISKKTYALDEYATAGLISAGVALFLLTNSEGHGTGAVTTLSGVFLLVGYMLFDSFTSNWQDQLFKRYKVSSIQMMACVNLWSCLFTASSLIEQGSFGESMAFAERHPAFLFDLVCISICSAVGQLVIFFTIARFGAVPFIIMMTLRQAFAILLSCMLYGHPVGPLGAVGVILVFIALFARIMLGQQKKKRSASMCMEDVSKVTVVPMQNGISQDINKKSRL